MAKTNIHSEIKKINRQADHDHWPASIKSTLQWFPLHANIEYTGNLMQDDMHLTSPLFNMFSLFEIRLSYGDDDLEIVSLKCFFFTINTL